jgi:hypothetical protein
MGIWRNGRRYGLKIRFVRASEGSTPSIPMFLLQKSKRKQNRKIKFIIPFIDYT